jgi:glucose-6-phosphate 1-dehydrogenase
MEPPVSLAADAIRDEKIKVLRSLAPIGSEDFIRGQYVAGEIDGEKIPGYLEAEGVPADSTTETFVALRVHIDNWRWQGVPFYLRTGKCLNRRHTQIAIRFKGSPIGLFRQEGKSMDTEDVLLITLQPNEGFSLHLDVKVPGSPFRLERIPLSFRYGDRFEVAPDAYRTLLHDVMIGDQTLFVHGDEVEESWRVYASLLDNSDKPHAYAPGSWGPDVAEAFTVSDKELWRA